MKITLVYLVKVMVHLGKGFEMNPERRQTFGVLY